MNLRTLKKLCKRAVPILIERHGFRPDAFSPADRDDTLDAPHGMERRYVRHGFLHPGPLPGTPLLWQRTSYEHDEWDASLPSEVLREIEFWESMTETDMAAMLDEGRRLFSAAA